MRQKSETQLGNFRQQAASLHAFNRIMCPVGERDKRKYFICGWGYTYTDDTVVPPEHILEDVSACTLRRMRKHDATIHEQTSYGGGGYSCNQLNGQYVDGKLSRFCQNVTGYSTGMWNICKELGQLRSKDWEHLIDYYSFN